ncbi:MAG: hypothetical protein AAF497_29315, partial [Planctomycetota bacterium]
GTSRTEYAEVEVRPSSLVHFFHAGSLSKEQQDNAAADWVLLDINDDSARDNSKYITSIGRPDDGMRLLGYPGGIEWIKEKRGNVEPAEHRGFRLEGNLEGVLSLKGSEQTGPGMSGGGLFNARKEFCGLHRSNNLTTFVFRSVDIQSIANKLAEVGLFFAVGNVQIQDAPVDPLAVDVPEPAEIEPAEIELADLNRRLQEVDLPTLQLYATILEIGVGVAAGKTSTINSILQWATTQERRRDVLKQIDGGSGPDPQ